MLMGNELLSDISESFEVINNQGRLNAEVINGVNQAGAHATAEVSNSLSDKFALASAGLAQTGPHIHPVGQEPDVAVKVEQTTPTMEHKGPTGP